MKFLVLLFISLTVSAQLAGSLLNRLTQQLQDARFDAGACYRIHDLKFQRQDVRFYLNSGTLIFLKPVEGRQLAAVFSAEAESGGDAEILLIPPTRRERASLAAFTKSPTLSEHFRAAFFLFTDDTAEELLRQIEADEFNRKLPEEEGSKFAAEWNSVFHNLSGSFAVRLTDDLLNGRSGENGFFLASIGGRELGNFDVLYDPRVRDQITLGKVSRNLNRTDFDFWNHFQGRSFREGKRKLAEPEFHITSYRIEGHFQQNLQLKVTTHLRLKADHALRTIPLDLSQRMEVTSASVNGSPATIFRKDSLRANLLRGDSNEELLVIPDEPLVPGIHEVTIHHKGDIVMDAGNQVYFVASRVNWYPQRGNSFADFDLIFRYPGNLGLVASGELVSEKTEGGERITHRRSVLPIRYAGFNLGNYELTSVRKDRYQVDLYSNRALEKHLEESSKKTVLVHPGTERLQSMAQEIADCFSWLASRLGEPPQQTLSVSPIPGQFGQGFAGLLYLSTLSYLDHQENRNLSHEMQVYYAGLLHSHETAHQWWGNTVTSPGYEDDWLQEALANYMALLTLERKSGMDAVQDLLDGFRERLFRREEDGTEVESTGPVTFGTRLQTSRSPGAWRTIIYDKGTWVIHMLRRRMGDELFWQLLRDLSARYRFQTLSTEQFQRVAASHLARLPGGIGSYRAADPQLDIFFETWINGTGIPKLQLEWKEVVKLPRRSVQGTIRQSEVPDDFMDVVPVEIRLQNGQRFVHWVRMTLDSTSFQITVPGPVADVQLDPEHAVLKR